MRWKRILLFAGLSSILPFATVTACGPDFQPDVFVRRLRPDRPHEFAAGKLGLLLPTFPRADLIVAYRYLNGGSLDATEQKAYSPTYTDSETESEQAWKEREAEDERAAAPLKDWTALLLRAGPPVESARQLTRQANGSQFSESYENCNRDAFRVALHTYSQRAAAWGEHSPELTNWITGQDAVFSNCTGAKAIPEAAPPSSPALLKADRAYQTAAAHFYAGDFEEAVIEFEAIHHDSQSPWRGMAGYVAARCLVRHAFFSSSQSDGIVASFDLKLMTEAAEQLKALLKENLPDAPKPAIQKLLNLVRIRIDPQARVHEISAALAGPQSDPNYALDLRDLTWYLNVHTDDLAIREDASIDATISCALGGKKPTPAEWHKVDAFHEAFQMAEGIRGSGDLVDWLLTFQSPSDVAQRHALREWQRTRALPWLLAAISKTSVADNAAGALINAASQIQERSPGWESITYHRARLFIESGKDKEARSLLESALASIEKTGHDSSINAYEGLRMHAAFNLDEFLELAPRKVLVKTSEANYAMAECKEAMENPKRRYDCQKEAGQPQFSPDAAAFFNRQVSLRVLIRAVESDKLPPQLQRSLALMAWTRSVLLKDEAAAEHLFPFVPAKLQSQAGKGIGFRAVITLVRNPGLRPYLEDGVQRNFSYDFVESYRDNWWCGGWQKPSGTDTVASLYRGGVSFLTSSERSEAKEQFRKLVTLGDADLYLGSAVLAYARANPKGPDVPEALYLVMRMARYSCGGWWAETDAEKARQARERSMVRQAASLLWHNYPKSTWTEKARPLGQ